MKCIITGVAGFLGSALAQELCKKGHSVVGLDNFLSGTKRNIDYLSNFTNFRFFNQDICTLDKDFGKSFGKFDVVFNLACPASPKFYYRLGHETLMACSIGLANVIELAKAHGAKLIQASTSEVYGEPAVHPQNESYFGNVDPVGPRSCYDEGKRFGEAMIANQVRNHGLNATILRIFNSYGPRMRADDGRVVTNFISAALAGRPLEIYGSGLQTRSFCYQSDTVAGFIAAWQKCSIMGPINVGSDNEISILELALLIKKLTDSSSKIITIDALIQDPSRRKADTTLAYSAMGWKPLITNLQKGLEETIGGVYNQNFLTI